MNNKSKISKTGLPPGSLIYTGNYNNNVQISLLQYNEEIFEIFENKELEEIFIQYKHELVNWIHITGTSNPDIISQIGSKFEIHPLVLEDIMDVNQLPKIENYGKQLFITFKIIKSQENKAPNIQQISVILGNDYLISFSETHTDLFELLTERIKSGVGKSRLLKEDYLFYMLIDKIVDDYFNVIQEIDERIDSIEDLLINKPSEHLAKNILQVKKYFFKLRKQIYPLRDELRKMIREETELISKPTFLYLNDVYDHLMQITQTMELFRDMIAGLLEMHLSNNDLRMNKIMTRLTVVATIFIPLTFLVGLYGMNLKMPETEWGWFYPFLWIFMIIISAVMLYVMKKKKWF